MEEIDQSRIAELCRKYHITRMLHYVHPHRTDAEQERRMDFMVDFEPGYTPGFFGAPNNPRLLPYGLLDIEEDLAGIVGKEWAYIMSFSGIGPHFRSKALDDARAMAEPIYPVEKAL